MKLIRELGHRPEGNKGKRRMWGLYECSFCGSYKEVSINAVKTGNTKGCGCRQRPNGDLFKHPLFNTWRGMNSRCSNPNQKAYKNYGGRGIFVCDKWKKSFKNFLEDMGEKPHNNYTLDRIDNDGPYSPENCKWSTRKDQCNNRRIDVKLTAYGVTQNIPDWAKTLEVTTGRLWSRFYKDWSTHDILFLPKMNNQYSNGNMPITKE